MALGPLRQANNREALRLIDDAFDGLAGSWPEAIRRHRAINHQIFSQASSTLARIRLIGVLQMFPALEQSVGAAARAEARKLCAIGVIAAWRYQLEHGRFPATLSDIPPTLTSADSGSLGPLVDPFDDQPLRYRVDNDSILIYSVSGNENDDGGEIVSRDGTAPADIGFTIKRRSSPKDSP